MLHTAAVIRGAPASLGDLVVGFGELWSTRIFSSYLAGRRPRGVRWIDARGLIVVDWGPLGPTVR
jgi:aspartokinase/homoserine dehydrogenase 1